MTTINTTTNVARGTDRVKLTAEMVDGSRSLIWAEHFRKGVLVGCGPTLAGLGGDLLHDCQMRLLDGFEDSMLWRRR